MKPPKIPNTIGKRLNNLLGESGSIIPFSGSTKQTDRTLSKHIKILLSPASANAYMRVALSCRYPHVEVLLSRTTTIGELIDRLTQYWQLNNLAQSVSSQELHSHLIFLRFHSVIQR